jgi:hypothetical protein
MARCWFAALLALFVVSLTSAQNPPQSDPSKEKRLTLLLPIMSAAIFFVVTLDSGTGGSGSKFPLSAVDRRIDELGSEWRIASEQDAQALVEALLAKFEIDERKSPGLAGFVSRLAKAEYAALRDPTQRIPENSVAEAFNLLMDRMDTPQPTRVSVEEVHAFRVSRSLMFYPSWVNREPDGNLPKTLRPVEATYLVYLLYSNGGVADNIRQAVSERGLPRTDPSTLTTTVSQLGLRAMSLSPSEAKRRSDYWKSTHRYLASHSASDVRRIVESIFALFRIA